MGLDRSTYIQERWGCTVQWRPFFLHPEIPEGGMDPARFYGRADASSGYLDRLEAMAEEVGLTLNRPPVLARTDQALEATEHVREHDPDAFDAVHHALFTAYWVDGRDIGDRDVLLDVVTTHAPRVDRTTLSADLDQDRYATALKRSKNDALSVGATGTPSWWIDDRFLLPGCQPREVFDRVFERLAATSTGSD